MTSITLYLIFIPILAFALLAINFIFAPHTPYMEKNSVFECGFHSFLGQNRTQFSISFFIFALLFLLFDLEILLMYPYGVSASVNSIYGLVIMLIFFAALTLGFTFELGKNALKIDSRQSTPNDAKTIEASFFIIFKNTGNIIYTIYQKKMFIKSPLWLLLSNAVTLIWYISTLHGRTIIPRLTMVSTITIIFLNGVIPEKILDCMHVYNIINNPADYLEELFYTYIEDIFYNIFVAMFNYGLFDSLFEVLFDIDKRLILYLIGLHNSKYRGYILLSISISIFFLLSFICAFYSNGYYTIVAYLGSILSTLIIIYIIQKPDFYKKHPILCIVLLVFLLAVDIHCFLYITKFWALTLRGLFRLYTNGGGPEDYSNKSSNGPGKEPQGPQGPKRPNDGSVSSALEKKRKKRESEKNYRQRVLDNESPEEKSMRQAKKRLWHRKWITNRIASETPEQKQNRLDSYKTKRRGAVALEREAETLRERVKAAADAAWREQQQEAWFGAETLEQKKTLAEYTAWLKEQDTSWLEAEILRRQNEAWFAAETLRQREAWLAAETLRQQEAWFAAETRREPEMWAEYTAWLKELNK